MLISKLLFMDFAPFSFFTDSDPIVSFLLLIDAKIYSLFSQLYELYIELARARLFNDETFSGIIQNIYVIFGVVALFIVAFYLLQAIVNPDEITKGNNNVKQLITRFILVIFLTCLIPTIFDFLYDFQDSLISAQVIPKALFGADTNTNVEVAYQDTNGNYYYTSDCPEGLTETEKEQQCTKLTTTHTVDSSSATLGYYGNVMGYYVLTGFLSPTVGYSDVQVNASKYFNTETGVGLGLGGCLFGIGATLATAVVTAATVPTTGGTATGFAAAATSKTGATAALACAALLGAGKIVNSVGEAVTADKYLWSNAVTEMTAIGNFDVITAFAPAVVSGEMTYTPFVSTISGAILLWMLFSFCLDLGLRAAKLMMYQLLAPISLLLSIFPKNKDLLGKWLKAVLSTWAEVFVRIFCLCGVALLISRLDFSSLDQFGLVARAIIVLGIVTFAKQAPKLFSEITGINSGNMKLGIKDKLKTAGAFALGAGIGRLGAGIGSMVAAKGNPFAFRRGWKNGWGNMGAETARRQERADALAAGATRRQIFADSLRKKFGFAASADAELRKIDQEKETVKNRTSYNIKGKFRDKNGRVINGISSQSEEQIDSNVLEGLEAQKTQNISEMAAASDDIRALDKKIAYGSAQIKFKSNLKGEAESKIDEKGSKVRYDFKYKDLNGNEQTFTGTYKEIEDFRSLKLTAEQLKETESLQTIRDKMVANFIASEMSGTGDNKIKQNMRAGFNTILNNGGYEYSYYDLDKDGNQITKTGKITVEKDSQTGEFIIHQDYTDRDGHAISQISTKNASGIFETITKEDGKEVRREFKQEYDIVSDIDKLAKGSNNVLNDEKQRIDETIIDSYRGQNEAIDNIIKQYNEQKEAKRKSEAQRSREASKKYTANRK